MHPNSPLARSFPPIHLNHPRRTHGRRRILCRTTEPRRSCPNITHSPTSPRSQAPYRQSRRLQFKHHAIAGRAAEHRRSVEPAGEVEGHARVQGRRRLRPRSCEAPSLSTVRSPTLAASACRPRRRRPRRRTRSARRETRRRRRSRRSENVSALAPFAARRAPRLYRDGGYIIVRQ